MNCLAQIQRTFPKASLEVKERIKFVQIKLSVCPDNLPDYTEICSLFEAFPKRDSVEIYMTDNGGSNLPFSSSSICSAENYTEFVASLYREDPVAITIEIKKQFDQSKLSIYSYQVFCDDLLTLSPSEVLLAFSNLYAETDYLYFDVLDTDIFFRTGTMVFSSSNHKISWELADRKHMLSKCREASCFYNQATYPLLPEDFSIDVDTTSNPLSLLFSQLSTILSLAYLATTSSIINNELRIQITGQRSIDFATSLTSIKPNDELYKIYHWIFTEGNVIDKALLARNSISAHCKFTQIIYLDGKTLASIRSNYNLYLRDSVAKYIELTNAMAGFIQNATNSVSDCISQILSRLRTNLIAVISFIFTVFLANIVSNQPLDNIFTYDITVVMDLVFVGSLFYYLVSIFEVRFKMKRMCKHYDDIVLHYEKVLSNEDIQEVTNNGQPLTNACSDLKKGMILWSFIWIAFVLVAFIVIDYIGDGPHIVKGMLSWIGSKLSRYGRTVS